MTSLQAAWSRGNIYTLLRFRDLQGWERAPGTRTSHLIALSVLLSACGTRLRGSRQGNTWLSPAPSQLGLFGLCVAIHATVKEVSVIAHCRMLYAMLSLKFRNRCLKAGVDLGC